jgi:uncharacterized protein YjiS (DUF1127 family)
MAREFRLPQETRPLSRSALTASGLAIRVIKWLAREIAVRRDMRRLAQFDDHMLRDIGVARADIEGAVRRGHDDAGDGIGPSGPNAPPMLMVLPGRSCRF